MADTPREQPPGMRGDRSCGEGRPGAAGHRLLLVVSAVLTVGVSLAVGIGVLPLWVPGECTYNTGSLGPWSVWVRPLAVWLLVAALALWWLWRRPGVVSRRARPRPWLLALLAAVGCLGWWVTAAAIEPLGFAKIAAIAASEASGSYLMQACETPDLASVSTAYRLHQRELRHHVRNKPPGGVLVSVVILNAVSACPVLQEVGGMLFRVHPGLRAEVVASSFGRFWGFPYTPTQAIAALWWALLVTAMGAGGLAPLGLLARQLCGRRAALVVVGLFCLVPAFVVGLGTIDLLYVLLTAWAVFFWHRALTVRAEWSWAAGALLGAGLFCSWLFLAVLFWFACWGGLVMLGGRHRSDEEAPAPGLRGRRLALALAGLVLGMAVLSAALFAVTGLNPWRLMQVGGELQAGFMAGRTYTTWLAFNLVDFVVFLGLPAAVLVAWGAVRWRQVASSPGASAAAACAAGALLALAAMDLSGRILGETARLWMMFIPACLLFAGCAGVAAGLSRRAWAIIVLLQLLQLVVFRHVLLLGGWA